MQPLSPRKRRIYLYSLILLFFVLFPIIILFAAGYRFKGEIGFVKTGGIYLAVPYSGALVSMNGEEIGESGLLKKSFYIGDLSPGAYILQVTREGDYPWHRTLIVESQLVTDADILLVSEDPDVVELSFDPKAATTTRHISKAAYDEYLLAFDEPAPTTTPETPRGILSLEQGNVFLRWTDIDNSPSSFYCTQPSKCVTEIPIETSKQNTIAVGFFGGGIVYATQEAGIFVTEGDVRPTEVFAPLYPVRGATFRIISGHLIVKDGKKLYEIQRL